MLRNRNADHLNTPRLIADETQKTVWRWDQQEPFGQNACNPDPDGDNVEFEFNLRFPGQYFDRETNLAHNYYRDYSPELARYIQSDPIGLDGGLNTYTYVSSSPLGHMDRLGLDTCGSGFTEGLVPDNPLFFPFSFCCKKHDQCYDNCFNKPSRADCDDNFCRCMGGRCQKYSGAVQWTCQSLANTYCYSVNSYGGGAFDAARSKCRGPECK